MKVATRWLAAAIAVLLAAGALALSKETRPPASSARPELEYLKAVNRAGPPRATRSFFSADGRVRERGAQSRGCGILLRERGAFEEVASLRSR